MNRRKVWGTVLLVWPAAALLLSFVLFAVLNWSIDGFVSDGASRSELQGISSIVGASLFLVGAAVVLLGLPSMIVGIVLLATPATQPVVEGQTAVVDGTLEQPVSAAPHLKNGQATASMVLGICALVLVQFLGFILGVLAIIFAALSLKRTSRRGQAIAGLVTGIIATIISFFIGFAVITTFLSAVSEHTIDSNTRSEIYQSEEPLFD